MTDATRKRLDISHVFKTDAESIVNCRENALRIHPTDIRAAGSEVEVCVRNYFERMLPPKFYITHGHLIDINGNVSSQLDLIIADNANLPSLLRTRDGTEYVPIDSVYAIGEIKSSYSKNKTPIEAFSSVLEDIRTRLFHEEVENTAYNGEITGDSLLLHMVLGKGNRILNRIFSFMVFVNGGDFSFGYAAPFFINRDQSFLPNVTVLLDKGSIVWASKNDTGLSFVRDPQQRLHGNEDWYFSPMPGDGSGSIEGNHLGLLYYMLVEHLNNSYLEPPNLAKYLRQMLIGRKSLLVGANGGRKAETETS